MVAVTLPGPTCRKPVIPAVPIPLRIWVNLTGFNSVHADIDFDRYPDPVSRRLAESLLDAQAFRFDLDDTIGGGFQQAFWVGATEYLSNPGDLDDILASIEGARGT